MLSDDYTIAASEQGDSDMKIYISGIDRDGTTMSVEMEVEDVTVEALHRRYDEICSLPEDECHPDAYDELNAIMDELNRRLVA